MVIASFLSTKILHSARLSVSKFLIIRHFYLQNFQPVDSQRGLFSFVDMVVVDFANGTRRIHDAPVRAAHVKFSALACLFSCPLLLSVSAPNSTGSNSSSSFSLVNFCSWLENAPSFQTEHVFNSRLFWPFLLLRSVGLQVVFLTVTACFVLVHAKEKKKNANT